MDRFIGKRLDGRYEIHELLGVGGMAYVYRAYDRIEDRWVAIKILKEEFSNNSDFLRRFRNEAKAITLLSHPNIVNVYDVSFGDQLQYIVMEYIDGITLKEYIEQQGIIRWNEALHFTIQILMALEHAHEKGIIHRDIKPQNIMLLQDGTIKVADFGIARFLQSETQTMTDKAIGSVHYIAPEQARGDYITDKADIYSVGVMLYEMITGRLPFVADSAVSVALMQLQAKPVMPREINPQIPQGLEQITMKAMEKNPVDRFQSAGEMLDDIEVFRRNPATVFNYVLQTGVANYDVARSMEAYDSRRTAPDYNDNYEYEEELVRSRKRAKTSMAIKGIIIALVIVLLAVGGIYIMKMISDQPEEGDDQILLPNLIGKIYENDVKGNEEYKDFVFIPTEGNDPEKQPGEILNQDPAGGKYVKKGREVKLIINGAVESLDVPEVTGYEQADAVNTLTKMGLRYKLETVADDTVESGKVVKTDPQAGQSVDAGSEVILYVSSGPSKEQVQIPDGLEGDLLFNVSGKLEDAGLKVGEIIKDDNSSLGENVVITTNPKSGTKVSKGSVVDITVSSGKGAKKVIKCPVELPSGVNEDLTMQIYRNGALIETKTVNPAYSGTYELSLEGTSGVESVVVQLNGEAYWYIDFDFTNQVANVKQKVEFVPSGGGTSTPEEGSENSSSTIPEE